jgi:hypothetical protein
LGDDAHPAVFNGRCAMFTNLSFRIDPQKPAIRLIKMRDISIRICNDGAIVETIEDKLVHFELPVYFFFHLVEFFSRHLVFSFSVTLESNNLAIYILFDTKIS